MVDIMKQLKKRAVLLLAFALLLASLIATAVSAVDSDPSVTFTFDSEECIVTLTYEGLAEPIVMESGKKETVPYGRAVTVTVEPRLGYKLHEIWNLDDPGKSIKNPYENNYYTSSFLASVRAEVECTTSVFDVKFEQADVSILPYEPESGDFAEFSGLTYHYKKADQLTLLPVVVRNGYTFQYWQVIKSDGTEVQKITTKNEDGKYYIPSEIINADMDEHNTIYLHAEFTPDQQPVIRYDYAYDTALKQPIKLLGMNDQWTAPMDAIVSALSQMGDDAASDDAENPYLNYKGYAGYRLVTNTDEYPAPQKITLPTELKPEPNVFQRYYEAIVYTLVYENLADGALGEQTPTTYTYDSYTAIPAPTRRGYTFLGWKVTVDGNVVDENTATSFVLGNLDVAGNAKYAAKDEKIYLSAIWAPNEYSITYDWDVTDADLKAALDELNVTLPKSYLFNSDAPIGTVAIANPQRNGYSFVKWILSYVDDAGVTQSVEAIPTDGKYEFASDAYACEDGITLTAVWQANKYTVVLNGMGATGEFTTTVPNVEFDQPLTLPTTGFVMPTIAGFDFDGYWSAEQGGVKYINADGSSNCARWDLYQDTDGVITLYARWIRKSYPVSIDVTGIPAGVSGLIIEVITSERTYVYGIDTIELPFESTFTVRITAPDGYKTVQWNGSAVSHSALYTSPVVTVEAKNVELSTKILPKAAVPVPDVDYVKEIFLLSDGAYLIYLDPADPMVVQINGNAISVNGLGAAAVTIPNEFFGQTVYVVYLGNNEYADSDPESITLTARPSVPKYNEEIHSIDNTYDTQIKVIMVEAFAGLYEYAISLKSDASLLTEADWKQSQTHIYLFEDLQPGTTYYVFIRRAATETTPHGEVYAQSTATLITKYLPGVIDRLNGMLNDDDGDLTRELIQGAIDTIVTWKDSENGLPATFYLDVEALLAEVEAKIAFVRLQDSKIALLESFRDKCIATGSLNSQNTTLINTLCAGGVADITAATQADQVEELYRITMAEMEIVPFSYLFDANRTLQLFSLLGLNQDSSLTLRRFEDMDALRRAVNEAIRTSGKVVVNSFMDLDALRELELVDAYRFSLINAIVESGDSFVIRLTLPDSLKGKTGLQVAYYNEATGMLELLETVVEGDELIFYADEVADFVILADPVVDLTVLIVILGVIMLCQIVAIGVILVSRSKGNKLSHHACTLLPTVLLTVHFAPVNAEKTTLILGGGVILLQIILMWLLLSSDMIHVRKRNGGDTPTQYPTEVPAQADDQEAYAAMDEESAEDVIYEDAPDEDDAGYEEYTAEADESAGSYEEYAEGDVAEVEEVFDDEEFIEPAANPYYSLPEDEQTFAYDDDADAGETDEDTDENAYAVFEADTDEEYVEEASDEYTEEAYAEEDEALEEVFYEDGEQVVYEEETDAYAYEQSEAEYAEEAEYVDEEYATDEELAAYDESQEEIVYFDEDAPVEETEEESTEETDENDAFYRYDE